GRGAGRPRVGPGLLGLHGGLWLLHRPGLGVLLRPVEPHLRGLGDGRGCGGLRRLQRLGPVQL
ncbi:unnamed protein product, partial [Heterosigma akashiwo]